MVTRAIFRSNYSTLEQGLHQNLIDEAIQIHGYDCYYMPRTLDNIDPILREATVQEYNVAYYFEMYIRDVQGFTGDGKFLSKFGLEIRDEVTFTISRRVFANNVPNQIRPNEGDLIFLPLNNKAFTVKFVDHEATFYQNGGLQTYDLVCEVFEYSNETFATGVALIDDIYNALSTTADINIATRDGSSILTRDSSQVVDDPDRLPLDIFENAQNTAIQTESDEIISFSETDPLIGARF